MQNWVKKTKTTHLHLEGAGVISRDQNIVETFFYFDTAVSFPYNDVTCY